jgi:hypothetical protein
MGTALQLLAYERMTATLGPLAPAGALRQEHEPCVPLPGSPPGRVPGLPEVNGEHFLAPSPGIGARNWGDCVFFHLSIRWINQDPRRPSLGPCARPSAPPRWGTGSAFALRSRFPTSTPPAS